MGNCKDCRTESVIRWISRVPIFYEQRSVTNLFVSSVGFQIYNCENNQYIVKVADSQLLWPHIIEKICNWYLSLVVRKPVFGVSDQIRHKPSCTAIEDG